MGESLTLKVFYAEENWQGGVGTKLLMELLGSGHQQELGLGAYREPAEVAH